MRSRISITSGFKKTLRKILFICIAVLIVIAIIIQATYYLKLNDDFYASAVPYDPIPFGMRSYDVKSKLGNPDQEIARKDFYQIGFAGNDYEFRETGEVTLEYNRIIFDKNAEIEYSYYKPDYGIDHGHVYIGDFETLEEARAVAEKLLEYATQKFEQKGDYSFEQIDSVLSLWTYRFKAENKTDLFMYDISIGDAGTLGLVREAPYSISIYQHIFDR